MTDGATSAPSATEQPATSGPLQRTPLHDRHVAAGARMVPFAGWEMPVQYNSILDEHRTVRSAVGLFDLSHMGELLVTGPEALAFARYAVVSDPGALEPGQAQYSMLCAEDGGIIDDLIVYRTDEGYLIVCNAANHDAVLAHLESLRARGDFDAAVDDRSQRTALIAPQGPRAADLLATLTDLDLDGLGYYRSLRGLVAGIDCLVARTGYTGEDGFELFVDARRAGQLWDALVAAGEPLGLKPCGLGSRDTLRLEAGMPLYGNELGRDVNPYEANLGRVVKLDKGEFMGRAALASVQQSGPRRKLVGLVMGDGAIARHGYPVRVDGADAGTVTSGTASPTLGRPVAMAFVPAEAASVGSQVEVVVRDRPHPAEQVKLPFYKRPKPDAG
ncbi:MAG TPA: glycine cleavage system aminomethyltransferase GcvT [Candidatus Limnocylindria bacterium]|nr:glycine cleavage system aminomethyltransferase GcvT [Candidatus Limnocylindria bacterium]